MKDLSYCRDQFLSLRRFGRHGQPLIYLDGPGGSQVPDSVVLAIQEYYGHRNSNTHGPFVTSQETDQVVLQARTHVAEFLGATPATISFGQNMTTLNFLLSQAVGDFLTSGDEIIVTDLDHDSNVAPWLRLQQKGLVIRHVPLTSSGTLDLDAFRRLITAKTRLVALGWASNALGTVNPVEEVRQWTNQVGAWLLIDAVHWAPHGLIDVSKLQPDFLLCSAYKFFGPHVGVLYAKPGLLETLPTLRVRPQIEVGPERIETGTLNHAALAGTTQAVNFIASFSENPSASLRIRLEESMSYIYRYEHDLAGVLYDGLADIPTVRLYGPPVDDVQRAPTISFTLEGQSSRQVATKLGERGILAWDGDFYAINAIESLGLAAKGGLVRLGLAPYNTHQELLRTIAAVSEIARAM